MAVSQSISLTQGTQNITNNTTQVTFKWTSTQTGESWNGYTRTAYYYVSINGGAETKYSVSYTLPKSSTQTIVERTFTVTHKSDGTGKISVRTLMDTDISAGVVEKSTSLTLKTIPRQADITDAPNFNDEGNPTISYSNPAGSSVTSLQACIANTAGNVIYCSYRDVSKTGTSYTFSLTDAERTTLRNACNSSNSMNIKFYIKTILGGNTFYSSIEKKISIINATPTFGTSNLSYKDNSNIVDVTNDDQMIVKGKSSLSATCTAATAKKGASISKYTFTLNGVTKELSSAGSASFGVINSSKDLTLSVFATDSRGNKSETVSTTVKCYDYFSPTISKFNAYRANSNGTSNVNGTYLRCDYTAKYASVNSTNEITVTAYYNGKSATCSNGTVLINLNGDTGTTYNVNLQISDKYGGRSSTSNSAVFGSSRILNITPDGTGIAIGKMAESSETLECRWTAKFDSKLNAGSYITTDTKFGSESTYDKKENFGIFCKWIDGENHDLLTRENNGLTATIGWTGADTYPTALDIRPKTVRVRGTTNIENTVTAPRGRFTTTNGASSTSQNDVPLRVGDENEKHLDISNNGIFSKASPTTSDNLTLDGDHVYINSKGTLIASFHQDSNGGLIQSAVTRARTDTASPNVVILSNGTFARSTSSSRRYKTDIQDVNDCFLNPYNVLDIPVRQFRYNKDNVPMNGKLDDLYIGFIAEEVEEFYPAAAEYTEDGQVEMWNIKVIVPAMLKIIQDQQKEICELKESIEELKTIIQN